MDDLSSELLSFIFDFVPRDSLELRKVCDDWDFVVTKYYNQEKITNVGTFKEILEVFYRSKLNVVGRDIFFYYVRYIYEISLNDTGIEDVSFLGSVHTLNLNQTNVKNVSALSDVHTLILSKTKVRDVSFLGNVHTLYLSQTKVKDVTCLSNVHTLELNGTNIKDVSALSRYTPLT